LTVLAPNGLRIRVSALVVSATLVGAGGGCGDGEQSGDAGKQVRAAYAQLQSRFDARDARGVCARITEAAKVQIGSFGHAQPTTCVSDVRQLFKWIKPGRAESTTAPRLVKVTVKDEKATATARLTSDADGRIPFVKEDGEWKLDNFFGITAPPPPDML
jgi:hypothetical protein